MELPKRKKLRLAGYDYSQNGGYFITICTKDRQKVLGEIIVGDDAHIVPHMALSPYGIVVEKYIKGIVGLEQYVIMPNHVHMIIMVDGVANKMSVENGTMWASFPTKRQSVSQLIQSFKILVTKEIGCSLWQRSFHDHIIRNQQEYEKIWEYIHTNPLIWEKDRFFMEE